MRKYIILACMLFSFWGIQAQVRVSPRDGQEVRMDDASIRPRLQGEGNGFLRPAGIRSAKLGTDKNLYGWLSYINIVGFMDYGLATFHVDNPHEDWQVIYMHRNTPMAAAVANGKMYAQMAFINLSAELETFSVFDCATWKETVLADISKTQKKFMDMTYDYSTETMYAVMLENEGDVQYSNLLDVNLTDGSWTVAARMDSAMITIACDIQGNLYGITKTGYLCGINKYNGKVTPIGSTGETPAFVQSMDIDLTDGTCYWAAYSARIDAQGDNPGYLAKVDLKTGKIQNLGEMAEKAEISGLWAPLPWDGSKAPQAVSDFTVEVKREASVKAELKFKAPEKTYAGAAVGSLKKIEIYRNYALVHTITSVEAGKEYTWTDDKLTEVDMAGYRVVAVNEAGNGLSAIQCAYVGEDQPGEVSDLSMSVENDTVITLSWEAPASGLNGGWYNPATVRYEIVRYPDNQIVSGADFAGTTFTENLSEYKYYWYSVRAYSPKGEGKSVECEGLRAGVALTLPYFCTFDTRHEGLVWEIEDLTAVPPYRADGVTWEHRLETGSGYLHYDKTDVKPAKDYAHSGPFDMQADKHYRLRFDLSASWSNYDYKEDMQVLLTHADSAIEKAEVLADYKGFSHSRKTIRIELPFGKDGLHRISFLALSKTKQYGIDIDNVKIDEAIDAAFSGVVKNKAGQALAGVCVALKRTEDAPFEGYTDTVAGRYVRFDTLYTDKDGKFDWGYTDRGEYEMTYSLFSYIIKTETVTVEPLKDKTLEVVLEDLPRFVLSGKVSNEYGEGIEGVSIHMKGYSEFDGKTGADGTYRIEGIYEDTEAYALVFFKNRYRTLRDTVLMHQARTKDVRMNYADAPVHHVAAAEKAGAMEISWDLPDEREEFRIDGGTIVSILEFRSSESPKAAAGVVLKDPMEMRSIKWWMSSKGGAFAHKEVDITVYAFDTRMWIPTEMLFHQEDVPCTDDAWSEYDLPMPIDIKDGCLIFIGYPDGTLALGLDGGKDETYPFVTATNLLTTDWENAMGSMFLEGQNIFQNLMIRATGVAPASKAKAADTHLADYTVYRLAQGKENAADTWTEIAKNLKTESYKDAAWSSMPRGGYRYAVTNHYNGRESAAALSNVVGKDMLATVNLKARTNTDPNEIEGAEARLVNTEYPEYSYTGVFSASGVLVMDSVWKGTYRLTIFKTLFDMVEKEVAFTTENEYTTEEYVLNEQIIDPYSLFVDALPDYKSKRFRWNIEDVINDDIEGIEDFMINPYGRTGWTYLDEDQAPTSHVETGSGEPVIWENVLEPHAFICMNIDKTQPPLRNFKVLTHSGSKVLMSMCGDVEHPVAKSDYIFSPELNYASPFVFSFWASSSSNSSKETIEVGYSTTGTDPKDFNWISGDVQVPGVWTQYSYAVPAEAKYVSVHVKTKDGFFFFLDDIYIGPDPNVENPDNSRALKYEIYLDGNKVAETENLSYMFTGLSDGTHKAGVVSVYQTGKSQLVEKEFKVDPTIVSNQAGDKELGELSVYPNPVKDKLYVNGGYDRAEILDLSGKKVGESNGRLMLDLSSLRPGMYFIRFVRDGASCVKKVIKL